MFIATYVFLVIIFSSFMQTVTGFGYAIITVPLLALVLGPKETVMLVMMTGILSRLFMLWVIRRQGSFASILPLCVASIAGAVPGALLMSIISNEGLKLFIGVVLLLASYAMWRKCTIPIRRPQVAQSFAGVVSGFLATTTSINGPPIVLYYLNSHAEENKDEFRANLTRYFFIVNIASVGLSCAAGTLDVTELWRQTLTLAPALILGFWLGEKVFYRINTETFRKVSLGMVFVSSLAMIASVVFNHG